MNWPDIFNGCFELLGSFFAFLNVRAILRDRNIAGIDWRTTAFFALWGTYNLFYYPHLHQFFSVIGAAFIVVINGMWVVLVMKYKQEAEDERAKRLSVVNDQGSELTKHRDLYYEIAQAQGITRAEAKRRAVAGHYGKEGEIVVPPTIVRGRGPFRHGD